MRLLSVTLQDVGVFNNASFDFDGNLIGILGPNGSGKSTLMSSLHYAVTGDLSRLGERDAVAKKRRHPGERPFVRLLFQPDAANTEPATIVRTLPDGPKSATRRLTYADQSWTSQADVNDRFERWTGLPLRSLSDFIFVEQGELARVVTSPPSSRAVIFQRLFGLMEAESARKAIDEHAATLPTPPDQTIVTETRVRLVEAEAAYKACQTEFDALPRQDLKLYDELNATIARYVSQQTALQEEASLVAKIDQLGEALKSPKPNLPDASDVERLRAYKKQWAEHAVKSSAYAQSCTALSEANRRLRTLTAVSEPGDVPVPSGELVELRGRKYAYEVVAGVDGELDGRCPVCRNALTPDVQDRETAADRLQRLVDLERQFNKAVVNYNESVKRYRAYTAQRDECERVVDAAFNTMTRLGAEVPNPPDLSLKDVELLLRKHDQAAHACKVRDNEDAANRDKIKQLTAHLDHVRVALRDRVSQEQGEAAQRERDVLREQSAVRRACEAKLTTLKNSRNALKTLLDRAERQASESAYVVGWRRVLDETKAILHRDAAPAQAAKACLEDLTVDLNHRLECLGARYRMTVNHAGDLYAHYHDGTSTTRVHSQLLSGGEQATLGLAWRIALLDRYAPNVGILCLDEPTNGLDKERVVALKAALEAWRPYGSSRQFVVVTHDRSLASVFDRVIQL